LIHKPALDVEIFRRNAAVGRVPILIAEDDLHGIIHVGGNAFDQRDLIFDGNGVSDGQRDGVVRAGAHAIHRAATGFNPHEVVP
jgi:hypothetical protein